MPAGQTLALIGICPNEILYCDLADNLSMYAAGVKVIGSYESDHNDLMIKDGSVFLNGNVVSYEVCDLFCSYF